MKKSRIGCLTIIFCLCAYLSKKNSHYKGCLYRFKYGLDSFIELKAIAKELRENGVDIFQIALLFGVHESTIYKWTAENIEAENSFPFSETTGKNVRYFKGKVMFDGKFH